MRDKTFLPIQFRDGSHNKATVFSCGKEDALTIICLPAMGVRAKYYELLAINLNKAGYNVITLGWRGMGHSDVRASRKHDFGYQELIDDLKEWVALIEQKFPNNQKILLGHSLGGQIGSLFISRFPGHFSGLILIASSLVFYKGWQGTDALKVKFVGMAFYPLSKLLGFFPGKTIGFGGREARSVMRDWGNNALTGNYDTIDRGFNYDEALNKVEIPVLSISIENDFLANKQAVRNLYQKFSPQAKIAHLHITEKEASIPQLNHFNWAKDPDYFVGLIKTWTMENGIL